MKDWKRYKQLVKSFLFDEADLSSNQMVFLMDRCYNFCVDAHEEKVVRFLCKCFLDLRSRALERIAIDAAKMQNLLEKPIISNKEMNKKIVLSAFGHRDDEEWVIFRKKAQTIDRTAKYLHRYFIPCRMQNGDRIEVRNNQHNYQPLIEMFVEIWRLKICQTCGHQAASGAK